MRGSLVALLFVSSAASADDLPAPLAEKDRAEIVQSWRKAYDAALQQAKNDLADQTLKTKANPDTGNQFALAAAKSRVGDLIANPTKHGFDIFTPIGTEPATGRVGHLVQPSLTVSSVEKDGGTVEGVTARQDVVRYFLPNPPKGAKKGAKVTLSGLWYVAGEAERGGRKLPVLYAFEVKPGELPPPPKKK